LTNFETLFIITTVNFPPQPIFSPKKAQRKPGFYHSILKDPMQDQFIYTFLPPVLNKPVHGLLETGRSIRTNRIVAMTESAVTRKLFGSDTGHFVTTASGSRHNLIILTVAALLAWLRGYLGVVDPQMEVMST
jgi:hypothetical protein